jgi:hypothetical protein
MYKKILSILFLTLFLSSFAYAEDEVASTFAKTSEYLKTTNSSLTLTAEQGFVNGYLLVKGEGLSSPNSKSPAQRRLTALRAAKVIAYRELAETMKGVAIAGDTLVQDMELASDRVRAAVEGMVKGAVVVSEEYNATEGSAIVLLKVGMNGPGSFSETMYNKVLADPSIATTAPRFTPSKAEIAEAKPVITAAGYDGLIIDASAQSFRPALINRIFSPSGEVIYDPSKISQKVLVDQGCGEYTNSIDKAKAALGARGVNNPLVVTAASAVGNTDLQVSENDAVNIFSANQKAAFLASAKVAFVVK